MQPLRRFRDWIFAVAHREDLRFPARFLLWATPVWFAIFSPLFTPPLRRLQVLNAETVAGAASLLGFGGVASGDTVVFGGGTFAYVITDGCTAWAVGTLFLAAVLAYPASWRERGLGLVVGLPGIFVLNLARLVVMGWIGLEWPGLFDQAHEFWWQAFIVFAVGLGWLAWARTVEGRRRPSAGGTPHRDLWMSILVVLCVTIAIEVVGVWTGLDRAYSGMFEAFAAWVGSPGPQVTSAGTLHFGGLAATLALYLGCPRVSARRRLRGIGFVGLPVQLGLALGLEGAYAVFRDGAGQMDSDVDVFFRLLALSGSVVAWWAWARSTWVATFVSTHPDTCPSCHLAVAGLQSHILQEHPKERRRLLRALSQKAKLAPARSGQDPLG